MKKLYFSTFVEGLEKPIEAMLMGADDMAGELKKTNDEMNRVLEELN